MSPGSKAEQRRLEYHLQKDVEGFCKRIQCAGQKTWQAIGDDILRAHSQQGMGSDPDKIDYSITMSRDAVVDCVMDFICEYGDLTDKDKKFWRELSSPVARNILTTGFKCDTYGW